MVWGTQRLDGGGGGVKKQAAATTCRRRAHERRGAECFGPSVAQLCPAFPSGGGEWTRLRVLARRGCFLLPARRGADIAHLNCNTHTQRARAPVQVVLRVCARRRRGGAAAALLRRKALLAIVHALGRHRVRDADEPPVLLLLLLRRAGPRRASQAVPLQWRVWVDGAIKELRGKNRGASRARRNTRTKQKS